VTAPPLFVSVKPSPLEANSVSPPELKVLVMLTLPVVVACKLPVSVVALMVPLPPSRTTAAPLYDPLPLVEMPGAVILVLQVRHVPPVIMPVALTEPPVLVRLKPLPPLDASRLSPAAADVLDIFTLPVAVACSELV